MGDLETIIFDFDGTLADSLPLIVGITRKLAKQGLNIDINETDIEYFRGMHVREIIQCIFSGKMPSEEIKQTHIGDALNYLKGNWRACWSFPGLLKQGLDDFFEQRKSIKLHEEEYEEIRDGKPTIVHEKIVDEVNKLSTGQNPSHKKYEILILSSNRPDSIYPIIHEQGLLCANVYHSIRLFGKDHELKRIMMEHGWRKKKLLALSNGHSQNMHVSGIYSYDTSKILYVGDEMRDVYACQKLGVHMLGVTWGFNNETALKRAGLQEDHLVHNPSELLDKVEYVRQIIRTASNSQSGYVC